MTLSTDISNLYHFSISPHTSIDSKILFGNYLLNTASEFLSEAQASNLSLKPSHGKKRELTTDEKIALLNILHHLRTIPQPTASRDSIQRWNSLLNNKLIDNFKVDTFTQELNSFKSKLSKIRDALLIDADVQLLDRIAISALKNKTEEFNKEQKNLQRLSGLIVLDFSTFEDFTCVFSDVISTQFLILNRQTTCKNQAKKDLEMVHEATKGLVPLTITEHTFKELKRHIENENALYRDLSKQLQDLLSSQMAEFEPKKLGLNAAIPLNYYHNDRDNYFSLKEMALEKIFTTEPKRYPVECINAEKCETTLAKDEPSFNVLRYKYLRIKEECHEPMLKCLPTTYPITMPNLLPNQITGIEIENEHDFKKLIHTYVSYFNRLCQTKQIFDKKISANIAFLDRFHEKC